MNMRMPVAALAATLTVTTPSMASAESQVATASASAGLNLQVVVPRMVFLSVGTGGPGLQDNNAQEYRSFLTDISVSEVGNGNPSTPAAVPVRVFGNNGEITLTVSGATHMTDSSGSSPDAIPLTKVSVSSDNPDLPAPAFGGNGVAVKPTQGRLTDRTADWTYTYANDMALAAGWYEGTVVYTATMP